MKKKHLMTLISHLDDNVNIDFRYFNRNDKITDVPQELEVIGLDYTLDNNDDIEGIKIMLVNEYD
jgi:hypothetical protein